MNTLAISILILVFISLFSAFADKGVLERLGIGRNALSIAVLSVITAVIVGGLIGNYVVPQLIIFLIGCYLLTNIVIDMFIIIKFLFSVALILLTVQYGENTLINSIIIAIFIYCIGDYDAERIVLTVLSTVCAFFIGALLSIGLPGLYIQATASVAMLCVALTVENAASGGNKYKSLAGRINGKNRQYIR